MRKLFIWKTTPPPPATSQPARARVFSWLASLASLVAGITSAVEITLSKLLKHRRVWERRDCDQGWWSIRLTRLNLVTRNLSEVSC